MRLLRTFAQILLVLTCGGYVAAEHRTSVVSYYGVPLVVDERVSAGGELLKVVLSGESFLVLAADAPRQVVMRYLQQHELAAKVSGVELEAIALAAAAHADSAVLAAALAEGLTRDSAREFDADELWQKLSVHHGEIVWRVVEGVLNRAPLGRVCRASAAVEGMRGDQPTAVPRGSGYHRVSSRVAQLCIEQMQRQAIEEVLGGREQTAVVVQLHGAVAPFAPEGAPLADENAQLEALITALAHACNHADSAGIERALTDLDVWAERLMVRRDVTHVRHACVARAAQHGAYGAALAQLASVPFESRSPTTHALVVAAVRGLTISDWSLLSDPRIRAMLALYTAKDEEISQQWIAAQQRILLELVNAKAVESAERLTQVVYREDPTQARTVLAPVSVLLVQGYLTQGAIASAERVVRELSVTLPRMTRLRLALAQRGLSPAQALGLVIGLGVVGLALMKRRRRSTPQSPPRENATRSEDPEIKRFEEVSPQSQPGECEHSVHFSAEYIAALRVFGLEPGATVAQIKNAYRSAVKQYHPDRQRGDYKDDTTLFIRLTAEYEKLLELHDREVAEKRAT